MFVMCGSVSGGASCFAGEGVVVCEYMFCVSVCMSVFLCCVVYVCVCLQLFFILLI